MACRLMVLVLPATSLLLMVKVTRPRSGSWSDFKVADQSPFSSDCTVTDWPVPVAIVTLPLGSVVPDSCTPAVRSAATMLPSPAMVSLV